VLLPLLAAAAGCVANGDAPVSTGRAEVRMVEMRFDCGEGETLRLTGDGAALVAADSHETVVRLEAAPPGQSARYGADGHALVLNDGEALWMKAGEAPMTCRR